MLNRQRERIFPKFLQPVAIAGVLLIGLLIAVRLRFPDIPPQPNGSFGVTHVPDESSDDIDEEQWFAQLRSQMVEQQLVARGIDDQRILDAMRRVPRHRFVPQRQRHAAYVDSPLRIGHEQTISQPVIVAMMTQLAKPTPQSKALDIGTGSGYQAAILGELVEQVYSVEILAPLATEARERLKSLGYDNIEVRLGDGYRGWSEHAPFDVIIVAAAPDHVPELLIEQLAPDGHLVIPVGQRFMQSLLVIEKLADGTVQRRNITPVAFVPMTGEAQEN